MTKPLRMVTAKVDGRTYQIPEMWLIGASTHMTLEQAVRHWHEQALAEMMLQP